MQKAPTIRDVARSAGVSVSVVSRVLNDGTGPVAVDTRRRVVEAIEQLGFRPRAAARELSHGQTLSIGLVLPDLTNPFFARLADSVVWEARARGAQVLLMTTQEDSHVEGESLTSLLDRSVGGVIATPSGENLEKWSRLRRAGIDVVFVDRTTPGLDDVDVVSIGNSASAARATDHLLALGHRRIAIVSGPLRTSTGQARVAGYRAALTAAGLPIDGTLIREVPFRGDIGGEAVAALLALPEPPTALIVANTAQVRSAVHRLFQLGVAIPEALSVVVFDDNPWSELVTPPLSVVRQPIDMLARHSVDLVLARMQGRIPDTPQHIEVQADLVIRSSCAAPAQR
ncbi:MULTISPECIES: LacI family DNA-binding transcriptional regulator [unclassified Rathayibacter]|uniref:LacI family DNA-binding transcriptional regulator n=1 Tax=unclassified Rathayibacter TaxID=2609250 RepID=UPI000F4D00EA|nr:MULTISPECIES: LacI family DNA-binding transcriptional regulator [unclassified Rathayibacter]MCJ1704116.1 LacI family DNA-binding transcriptional regulator [Rathayibacter sp. VKM Ac-2926]ROP49287.1 LacI family transcriptional regulator [Rathayibacter sp. PhB186]ROS50596.1 LacI family transcriptional regulator [Rathayibacter sp. PhB185]TCL83230.1 LacI family transcriptional regulator [Rathayibacter sp. PhB192]TCM28728.1 LacI family transcriptional regulator [Rathayibacter sp. PhB179]